MTGVKFFFFDIEFFFREGKLISEQNKMGYLFFDNHRFRGNAETNHVLIHPKFQIDICITKLLDIEGKKMR